MSAVAFQSGVTMDGTSGTITPSPQGRLDSVGEWRHDLLVKIPNNVQGVVRTTGTTTDDEEQMGCFVRIICARKCHTTLLNGQQVGFKGISV